MSRFKQFIISALEKANKRAMKKAELFEEQALDKHKRWGHFSHIWRNIMAGNEFFITIAQESNNKEMARVILRVVKNIVLVNTYLFLLHKNEYIKDKELNSYEGYYGNVHTGDPSLYVRKLLFESIKKYRRRKNK